MGSRGVYGRLLRIFITFKVNQMCCSMLMICNHCVGKLANERWNDADVCFLRELLQRRVPV